MGPLPYPHRATFLASTLVVPVELDATASYAARLISVIVFDHLVRHPVVTLGDHDDERLVDETGRLLDARHPQAEDSIDWFFRVSRRHEVLWFEISLDPTRPAAPVLRARRPDVAVDGWGSSIELSLSQQLGQCIAQWLGARRLPPVGPFTDFTLDDLRAASERLAKADVQILQGRELAEVPASLTQPPGRLAIPFLRVLAELTRDEARTLDPIILQLDPTHPVARRNRYVTGLLDGTADRREILPLIEEAPMYAKPHLSIWGEPFAADRPLENMGVRHQGIAASLMPANPYACHNYSLQLADDGRREESYRWADRATVAAPQFGAAHLDCVRRLRQVGRPGQAFAEAQYRCREILDRAAANKLPLNDWQAPHHAALLIAFAHLDVGRIAEAIELADDAMARLPDDAPTQEAFAWAQKRIAHWKSDASLLARAYAWEGHHRGDPGRVIVGLTRGRITDDDDAMMLIESLVAIGRDEQAEIAYWQCAGLDGTGVLGDGKARLAAAKALILRGNLDEALDQIQTVQLRRSQSRLEAEINRLFRLAATRPAADWERVIERRLERGSITLAQRAARDLADFVPNFDTPIIRRALGGDDSERHRLVIDPLWIAELIGAVPAAQAASSAILNRLAWPKQDTLAAADALAQEWWTALVPPARDRDAHAGGAVLALGLSLANYLVAASGPPTPIAGAYRHIATEALHLVRRSRYQIDTVAIQALLRMVDWLGDSPEWLLDTWLLRVERALDLEAEHGAYLDGMTAGMPVVQRFLRGDDRIGWELRLAHDLAVDPSQYEPVAMLYGRCSRAVEAGGVMLAWSTAAVAGAPLHAQLDIHWLAAMSNPTGVAAPWLRVAHGLLGAGRPVEGFAAACRGMAATVAKDRAGALAELAPHWKTANISTPLDPNAAFEAGLAAASEDRLDVAVQHLRWAASVEPANAKRGQSLAVALGRLGHGLEAIRVLAQHERVDAPRLIGRVLLDAGRDSDAVPVLRYASRRFRTADDWANLALAAARSDNDPVAVESGRRAIALGSKDPAILAILATGLYRMGDFNECEGIAQQLITEGGGREARVAGLHAMARALAGQGRHVDAHPYAKAAAELGPNGELAADLIETMDRIVAQQTPPIRPSVELSMERQACADLEAGKFDTLVTAIASPSWGIARVALCACEFRKEDESGIPVAPRALEGAIAILARSEGAMQPEAVLARIRALRIRDNAFIQIDPAPPLGLRYTPEEFDRIYAERDRRPHRPSAIQSFAR
jgi:tetratricopeptide (TPR) repeat protein